MWLLGLLLPQMIGERVSEVDEYWVHYLDPANLDALIHDYLQDPSPSPHASEIPKLHYLVHMPRLILE